MSFTIALSRIRKPVYLSHIKKCSILVKSDFVGEEKNVDIYSISEDGKKMIVPMGMLEELGYSPPPRDPPLTTVGSTKKLFTVETDPKKYRDQDQVVATILERWETTGSAFLAATTGFGKTTIGQHLAAVTKLKTAVVCHLSLVQNQWKDEFENFTNAKVQMVKGKKGLDPEADVYIFGIQKACSFTREELRDIGLVIFDEAHLCAEAGVRALLSFQPKYLLGLSATPHLSYGGGALLEKAFGKGFIYRREVKDFTVTKVESDFVPEVGTIMVGGQSKMDWVGVINSVCYNPARWGWLADIILEILAEDPSRMLLVLSQRKKQTEGIIAALKVREFESVIWIKSDKTPNREKYRVQIAGLKKAGAGYDDPSRNCGMIIDDMINVNQYEGRIRAAGCFIYDVVDCFSTFEKHWETREEWYLGRGATIRVRPRRTAVKKYAKSFARAKAMPQKCLF